MILVLALAVLLIASTRAGYFRRGLAYGCAVAALASAFAAAGVVALAYRLFTGGG